MSVHDALVNIKFLCGKELSDSLTRQMLEIAPRTNAAHMTN